MKEKNSSLDDNSTKRVLYLALLQDDPKYVLDFLYMCPLKNTCPTFVHNFKAMAYTKLNRFEDALDQIDLILSMGLSNEPSEWNGLVFQETVNKTTLKSKQFC